MNQNLLGKPDGELITHSGFRALCGIAAYYRIAADPLDLARDLAIFDREASENDLLRAAKIVGLKAHIVRRPSLRRLERVPTPAILRLKSGDYCLFTGQTPSRLFRVVDPITRIPRELTLAELVSEIDPIVILVARHFLGKGVDPRSFGFRWFAPSLWRYRRPLIHVLIASFFVQIFALVSPLFFQVVIDKVLTHRGYSTLFELVAGLAAIGLFDAVLQYLPHIRAPRSP